MFTKSLRIDELKKVLVKKSKKLMRDQSNEKCMEWIDCNEGIFKSTQYSETAKAIGNELYAQKDLDYTQLYRIAILFNISIASAPKGSEELATAYANKSAVLMRMRKYQECITEIDKALKITESMPLKIKMLCRKTECLTALGSSDNRGCLEKARFFMSKLESSDGEKVMLNKLIKKTQSNIVKDKLDVPKEDKKKIHALKMIREAERRDLSESIIVEYSEKYGRHLVAARDFEPGDIVLVETPYFNDLDDRKAHLYCSRCFNHLWTAVPCDHCDRHLYCSEKCKIDTWNEYHETECFAGSNMIRLCSIWSNEHISFLVGIFSKALKEAGSIEQLVADSESSIQCKDLCDEEILLKKGFITYKNIFTLPILDIRDKSILEGCIERSMTALIGLARYTKILGRTYDSTEIKNLMKDDVAVLVGALLLKLALTFRAGCPAVVLMDPDENIGDEGNYFSAGYYSAIAPLLSMHTLIGCIPNVDTMYTYGNRCIIWAIKPIKAGDQLIVQSRSNSIWKKSQKSVRQSSHRLKYQCPCECQACKENWSVNSFDAPKFPDIDDDGTHCPAALKLWNEMKSILSDWEASCHKPSFPDVKIFCRARELVAEAWKQLSMPSLVIYQVVWLLMKITAYFFEPTEVYKKVPNLRSLMVQCAHVPF